MGCLTLIFFIFLIVFLFNVLIGMGINEDVAGYLSIIVITGIIIYFVVQSKDREKKKQENEEQLKEGEKAKRRYLSVNYGLPIECKRFVYWSGYDKFPKGEELYVWKETEFLSFLSDKGIGEKHQILLADINYFSIKGDIRQETQNKGGDLSVGETIITEGLLGTAAAIKGNQITQETKTIDERKTIINAIINDKNTFIFFEGADLYRYLLETFPEKEQSFVAMNR